MTDSPQNRLSLPLFLRISPPAWAAALRRFSFFPRSLYGRTLLILVLPVILLQFTVGFIFYGSHWNNVTNTVAVSIAGKIHRLIDTIQAAPERLPQVISEAKRYDNLNVSFKAGEFLRQDTPSHKNIFTSGFRDTILIDNLHQALSKRLKRPFQISFANDNNLSISVQFAQGLFTCLVPPQQLLGSTVYIFLLWMIGASLLLFSAAALFLLYQIRPIKQVAEAVDLFGRGVEHIALPHEGALEIKRVAQAFDNMKRRIQSQLRQRSDMLMAVSHDLRTPLTRIRLETAMIHQNLSSAPIKAITNDIKDMERMIESYLTFAKGEGEEHSVPHDICLLTQEVVTPWQRRGLNIDLHHEKKLIAWIKPLAMKRCLDNIVGNAVKYAQSVRINVGKRGDLLIITVDDNGPGIPKKERTAVFRPFYRTDAARTDSSGTGLGLSIALDITTAHGGTINIEDSPLGGTRIIIALPL
jgi:two-component system osmolarity sensor histidine kinase EnvZ